MRAAGGLITRERDGYFERSTPGPWRTRGAAVRETAFFPEKPPRKKMRNIPYWVETDNSAQRTKEGSSKSEVSVETVRPPSLIHGRRG